MAGSRFEYVKDFEQDTRALRNCWVVVRIDGRSFTEFCDRHKFEKPNDHRCARLMNRCAWEVMKAFGDVIIAYGQSDEFSFVFKRESKLWNRRECKIVSNLVSYFTSCFVCYWHEYFLAMERPLYPPSFDARIICYPTNRNLKDYLAWRQVDCHINNQYNVCFWSLVNIDRQPKAKAYEILRGTLTSDKNEMLFTKFGINYNNLPAIDRKGTVIVRVLEKRARQQKKKQRESTKADSILGQQLTEEASISESQNEEQQKVLVSKAHTDSQIEQASCSITKDGLPSIPTTGGLLEMNVDLISDNFWNHFWFLLDDEKV